MNKFSTWIHLKEIVWMTTKILIFYEGNEMSDCQDIMDEAIKPLYPRFNKQT